MKYISYYILIVMGALIVLGTLLKLIANIPIDSDWFWFLAGLGLAVEGLVTLIKQKRFDKKYKIIKRNNN